MKKKNAVGPFLLRPYGSKGKKEGNSDTVIIIKTITRSPLLFNQHGKEAFPFPTE